MRPLNETNRDVLDFLSKYITKNRCAPSYKEIMQNTGVKTTSHVEKILNTLEEHGEITRKKGIARSIVINGIRPGMVQIPIFGEIAAGAPIPAPVDRSTQQVTWEDYPMIEILAEKLPRIPAGSHFFALTVRGDSMIEDGILDGDRIILYRPQGVENNLPNNTHVAAWLVEDETMTLKHYQRKADGSVWLVPANPRFEPREFKDPEKELEIHGIMVHLDRNYF